MNLTQAEAIANLYTELLNSIDKSMIIIPEKQWRGDFTVDHIDEISLDEGQVKITWSKYAGCGDYDTATSYQSLHTLFD